MARAVSGGLGVGVVVASLWNAACGGPTTSGPNEAVPSPRLLPLSAVTAPQPVGGDVIDVAAAVRLGKAFFWDVQVGSDGLTACATCHFHAGADNRRRNTIHPGPNAAFESVPGPGETFGGAAIRGDDVVGSQGIPSGLFVALPRSPRSAVDECRLQPGPPFGRHAQVTARNSPSVIGAVYYRDVFWDGRAHNVFNGLDPFGPTGNGSGLRTRIENASLASQAVGPPNNAVESACAGRAFDGPGSLGSKLLARPPLQFQVVAADDGVLGDLSNAPATGLRCAEGPCSYGQLVEEAFGPELARDAEAQFARIWGQALLAYESTLVPDQTPFDRHLAGSSGALTESERLGLSVFQGKAGCAECHAGTELSDATVDFAARQGLLNRDGGDQGFHNIGVRPTDEDLGRAALGPGGVSFSASGSPRDRGAFKTPGLRNVALTAPYFHNGSKATLAEVIEFYARGGEFANPELSTLMRRFSVDQAEIDGLVDFITRGLTDCRVQKERAPFDHPSLPFADGTSLPAVGAGGHGSCPP
jgi:cytochrome c peroxidase